MSSLWNFRTPKAVVLCNVLLPIFSMWGWVWRQQPFHKSPRPTNEKGWNSISSFLFHHCLFSVLNQGTLSLHHGPCTCNRLWDVAALCYENILILNMNFLTPPPKKTPSIAPHMQQISYDIQTPVVKLQSANANIKQFSVELVFGCRKGSSIILQSNAKNRKYIALNHKPGHSLLLSNAVHMHYGSSFLE